MPDTVVSDRTNVVQIARQTLSGSVDVVTEDSSLLVEVRTDDWFGSPLAEYGGVLREASAEPDETMILVEVPRQADVRLLRRTIAEYRGETASYCWLYLREGFRHHRCQKSSRAYNRQYQAPYQHAS
jgi:hypothetical protein